MRIISGALKGRKLRPPKGKDIRPTSDKVREAIFSILFSRVEDAAVADIFAGTGAMGMEALSRGAAEAVFIDKSLQAISLVKENLQAMGLEARSQVLRCDIVRNPDRLARFQSLLDIVFVDPPYKNPEFEAILGALESSGAVKQDGLVIFEHGLREKPEKSYGRFKLADQRKYGKTLVSFFSFML